MGKFLGDQKLYKSQHVGNDDRLESYKDSGGFFEIGVIDSEE